LYFPTNPDNLAKFDLTEAGLKVQLYDHIDSATAKYSFVLGKSWPSQFLTMDGRSEVLKISKSINTFFDKPQSNDWREKRIISRQDYPVDDVLAMQFSYNKPYKQTYSLSKAGEIWQTAYNAPVEQNKLSTLLNSVLYLNAIDFVDSPSEDQLKEMGLIEGQEEIKIDISFTNDRSLILLVGKQNEAGNYYAKLTDSNQVYIINDSLEIFKDHNYNTLKEG